MTTCCTNYKLSPTFGSIESKSIMQLYNSKQFNKWRISRMLKEEICSNCGGLGGYVQRYDNYILPDEKFRFLLLKNSPKFIKNIIGAIAGDIHINKIAWWIPIKKWRDNFRKKFE